MNVVGATRHSEHRGRQHTTPTTFRTSWETAADTHDGMSVVFHIW